MVLFACFFVCFFVLSLLFLAFTLYVRMGGRGKFINTNDIFFSPKDINKENIKTLFQFTFRILCVKCL